MHKFIKMVSVGGLVVFSLATFAESAAPKSTCGAFHVVDSAERSDEACKARLSELVNFLKTESGNVQLSDEERVPGDYQGLRRVRVSGDFQGDAIYQTTILGNRPAKCDIELIKICQEIK